MSSSKRIGVIYRKELIDILRDRRTLLAMVLIPIVLYPMVILGFLWLMQTEETRLHKEHFVVEVDDPTTREELTAMIAKARASQSRPDKEQSTFDVQVRTEPGTPLGNDVQLHVTLSVVASPRPLPSRLGVEVAYNEIDARSRSAMEQLVDLLQEFRRLMTRDSVEQILGHTLAGSPTPLDVDLILNPLEINSVSIATQRQRGGWALGLTIPVILVLMTITGAIYPAIDLTAGERERGTLETLMVTPVPPLHLIVGKFLVVATVALMTAMLNLASVGATMHFGGLTRALTAEMPVEFPLGVLPIILLCMVPFAMLFSAILLAVCSFARTFREAQTYVMPVIIAALIPGAAVALPSVRLEGVMLVVPVANMVLLTRELFQQTCPWSSVLVVLLSTSLYAVAAIVTAARLFGQEAVLFVDVGSYKTLFCRRFFRPHAYPTAAQSFILAAVLFPVSFYVQGVLLGNSIDAFMSKMKWLAVVQFGALFVLLPVAASLYLKTDLVKTFRLRWPPRRAWLAAFFLGLSSWALAHEFLLLQPRSPALAEFGRQLERQLTQSPVGLVLLLLAVVPAISEEFFFRGFLLSGLATTLRRWPAMLTAAAVFAVFHFMVDRMPLAALLGLVLAYLCWQSRSILPGILFHAMHNASAVLLVWVPQAAQWLGLSTLDGTPAHLRLPIILSAGCTFLLGLLIVSTARRDH